LEEHSALYFSETLVTTCCATEQDLALQNDDVISVNNCPTRCNYIQFFTTLLPVWPQWILCLWVRASWINVSNCPTRCDYMQSDLVGQLLTLIHDARTHEHKKKGGVMCCNAAVMASVLQGRVPW